MEQITRFCLIGSCIREDALHQVIPEEKRRFVLGTLGSVSGSEFSNAGVLGIRSDCRIIMFAPDYCGELEAELYGKRYTVYRTYQPTADKVELYLTQKAGDSI